MAASISRRRFLARAGSVALAAGVGGSLLEACGGSSSSSGPVNLTYGWWSNGPVKDNAMKAWVESFSKVNPKIKVQPEILSWADYWNKLQTTVSGNNAWDIIGMAGGMAAPYFDQGALYDLSTFSDYQAAIKSLIPSTVQLCNWNGKQYALPAGVYVPLLGYNKSLLKAANIPFPDPTTPMTFEEFKAIAAKLSLKSGGQYKQYAININDFDPLWTSMVLMEGGQVYDNPINPKKVLVNSPAGIKGLTDWQSLYTENLAVPIGQQANGPFGAGDLDSLQTNKVAFSRIVLGDFLQIQQQNLTTQVGVTPLFSVNGKYIVSGNVNSFGIFANSQHPNEAWEFIKWATGAGAEGFGKVSDAPADQTAFNNMASYIQPTTFAQTLIAAEKGFTPIVMTPKQQYGTDIGDILTDLANGKITPAQAAQQIETKGNADLSAAS
ncbi:MAG TPA: sugar ABC transporter substrate-binding protein [Ktedonobacteraceae bacterium]|nr:sugar ABC transporter substrate-binding protein [Ktedonobacteraceae bacterium]